MADGQVAYVGASAGSLLVVLAVPLLPPLFGRKPLAFRRQFRLHFEGNRPHVLRFCGSDTTFADFGPWGHMTETCIGLLGAFVRFVLTAAVSGVFTPEGFAGHCVTLRM